MDGRRMRACVSLYACVCGWIYVCVLCVCVCAMVYSVRDCCVRVYMYVCVCVCIMCAPVLVSCGGRPRKLIKVLSTSVHRLDSPTEVAWVMICLL